MAFRVAKWFKWKQNEEKDSDITNLLSNINANISNGVKSVLEDENEKEAIKDLYKEIFDYLIEVKKNNSPSLINDNYILEAIKSNIGNYGVTLKIFNFVKSWDSNSYLPKNLKLILKNQIPDSQIEELEEIYGEFNVLKKDTLKDDKYYYYVNSQDVKMKLTKAFGDLAKTQNIFMQVKFIDNSRKVSKELVDKLTNTLRKRNSDGTRADSLRIIKLRNVPYTNVIDNDYLNSIFEEGLVNAGNVLSPSNTTIIIKNKLELLKELKDNTEDYNGFFLLDLPGYFFDEDDNVLPEYEKELFINVKYQVIDPNYISMLIVLKDDKVDCYYRTDFTNKDLDLPKLKAA